MPGLEPFYLLPPNDQEGTALSEPICVSIPTILFLLFVTCFTLFVSVWKFISTQLTGEGLATGPRSLVA